MYWLVHASVLTRWNVRIWLVNVDLHWACWNDCVVVLGFQANCKALPSMYSRLLGTWKQKHRALEFLWTNCKRLSLRPSCLPEVNTCYSCTWFKSAAYSACLPQIAKTAEGDWNNILPCAHDQFIVEELYHWVPCNIWGKVRWTSIMALQRAARTAHIKRLPCGNVGAVCVSTSFATSACNTNLWTQRVGPIV